MLNKEDFDSTVTLHLVKTLFADSLFLSAYEKITIDLQRLLNSSLVKEWQGEHLTFNVCVRPAIAGPISAYNLQLWTLSLQSALLPPELFQMPFNPSANGNTSDRERLKADGDVIGTMVSLQFLASIFQEPISSYIRMYLKKKNKSICLMQILLISR